MLRAVSNIPLYLGSFAYASLPAASSSSGRTAIASDVGVAPGTMLISDGTRWLPAGVQVLVHGGIPVGLPSSGSIANNGALTLTTALLTVYSGGIYLYFPASAISSGSAAGLYYCVMSSTTVGTIFNNTYTAGTPLPPASPTAFVTTGPGAYTQTLSEITMNSYTVPGNLMGINGGLSVSSKDSLKASANSKTFNVKLGGQTALNGSTNNAAVNAILFKDGLIENINSTTRQLGEPGGAYGGSNGLQSGGANFFSVDTTTAQTLSFTRQLAVATDFIIIDGVFVKALP